MKNLVKMNTTAKCYDCEISGFFMYTPQGADYYTCPCCTEYDFVNTCDEELFKKYFDRDNRGSSIYEKYKFCSSCKIIYDIGCRHAENGCTSSCYNGHFIGKYKYRDEIYIGMPQFETVDEWYNELKNIEILEWICPNNGIHCTKGYYPKIKFPKYYSECSLCNTTDTLIIPNLIKK
jgi:hypothetical protein